MAWWEKFAFRPPPKPPDLSFLDKYAPKTRAPSIPQTVAPAMPAMTGVAPLQTKDAILRYNNGLSFFAKSDMYENSAEGVVIHRITDDQAAAISTRIKPSAFQYELPLAYALACLAIESTLDPQCVNKNIGTNAAGVVRSNPSNDPAGSDVLIAQLKLKYLVNAAPGVGNVDEALAFALDVDKAIPYFCSLMATKVLWATNIIERDSSSAPDVRFKQYPFLLATGNYNFGPTGMLSYYETGQFPSHCQHVVDLSKYFSKALGQPDVFPDITA
jgi:hypothetical protein